MTFAEKLNRLCEGRSRAQLARSASLKPSLLNNYINRGSAPMATAAMKLSKALGVPLAWLLDDAQGYPPPAAPGRPSPAMFSDGELMLEVARRFRIETILFLEYLAQAEKVDWHAAAQELVEVGRNDPIPASIRELFPIAAAMSLYALRVAKWFTPQSLANANHLQMPGSDRPLDDFSDLAISQRLDRLGRMPGYREVLCRLLPLVTDQDMDALPKGMRAQPRATAPIPSRKPRTRARR